MIINRLLLGAIAGLSVAASTPRVGSEGPPAQWPRISQKMIGSGIRIHVSRRDGSGGYGTGFLADLSAYGLGGGYVITAGHVVQGMDDVEVELSEPRFKARAWMQATVCFFDEARDIAVIRIRPAMSMVVTHIATEDDLEIGDPVIIVGCPGGTAPTASLGWLAAKEAYYMDQSVSGEWTCSAAVWGGNSGGPVFNANTGEVCGVLVACIAGAQGSAPNVSIFVPAKIVLKTILDHIGACKAVKG